MSNLTCSECSGEVIRTVEGNDKHGKFVYHRCSRCGKIKVENISEKIDMSETAGLEVIMD